MERKIWTPEQAASNVFTSIGISQGDQGLQLNYLRLLRAEFPIAELTEEPQTQAMEQLSTHITEFIRNKHKRMSLSESDLKRELDFQQKALAVLSEEPKDKQAEIRDIFQGLIMRDDRFIITATGRGYHAPCPHASFLRNLLLDQFPFPISSDLQQVNTTLRETWNNPELRAKILEENVWQRESEMRNCDITEETYQKRLVHVKQSWEKYHDGQLFQIY